MRAVANYLTSTTAIVSRTVSNSLCAHNARLRGYDFIVPRSQPWVGWAICAANSRSVLARAWFSCLNRLLLSASCPNRTRMGSNIRCNAVLYCNECHILLWAHYLVFARATPAFPIFAVCRTRLRTVPPRQDVWHFESRSNFIRDLPTRSPPTTPAGHPRKTGSLTSLTALPRCGALTGCELSLLLEIAYQQTWEARIRRPHPLV